jgi:AcrR family transcriptional regulator
MAAAIRECGFRDSTVADVVRHARTSRRTFYEHFPGKQACFIALLQEANRAMVRQIAAAVDRRASRDVQVRQAIEAWIAVAQSDLPLPLSWIRHRPAAPPAPDRAAWRPARADRHDRRGRRRHRRHHRGSRPGHPGHARPPPPPGPLIQLRDPDRRFELHLALRLRQLTGAS